MFSKSILLARGLLRVAVSRPAGQPQRPYSLYEPDYLDLMKPKYPVYETINIQVRGYDYAILENYQRFIHRIADSMDLDIADGWATPPQQTLVQRLKQQSTVVETEYRLCTYNRTVQLANVAVPLYPLLLRVCQAALPEGVSLRVVEHSEDHEEIRYVPDRELIELKTLLDDMGGPSTKKK